MSHDAGEAGSESSFTLDAVVLAQRKAASERRLYTLQVPALRAAGMVILCVILALQATRNGDPSLPAGLSAMVAVNLAYAALAWAALRYGWGHTGKLDLGLLLFHLDVLIWLPNLQYLERSNLFFAYFLLVRVADQVGFGFRRALYFGHLVTLAYLGYTAGIAWADPPRAMLPERLGIAIVLYLLGLYLALTGLVTERLRNRSRQAVHAARTLVENLEQKTRTLQAQAAELQRARQAAEQASRAKSQFLAVTSHEIRTPMNGILGAAELLIATPLSAQQQRYVQITHQSATTLLALIDDVLDLSRIESGKLTLHPEPVDLRELAEGAVELAGITVGSKPVTLSFQISPLLPPRVLADPLRLRQLLVNLLNNAVKFTERGSVRLEIAPRDERAPAVADAPRTVRFSVRDTGIGIAPERLEDIFAAFSQVDASSTRRHGGSGLGLAIVRQVVELMGGRVQVQSRLGSGSHFWVDIPLQGAAAPPSQPLQPAAEDHGDNDDGEAGIQVLLVEDEPVNRLLVQQQLIQLGCEVDLAADGEAARHAASRKPYDIVFMDCHMPVMDGYEATRCIRADEQGRGRHTPIIALTADSLPTDRQRCLEAGMDGFMTKPVSSSQISAAIERWTGRRTFPATRW